MFFRLKKHVFVITMWLSFFLFALNLHVYHLQCKNCEIKTDSKERNETQNDSKIQRVSQNYRKEQSTIRTNETFKNRLRGPHKMAVIVPFRDRFDELMEFVPYVHEFLNKKKVRHKIYVINQVDNFRFNRGSLINVGFMQSRNECDYIGTHDVDLIPVNPNISYPYPENGPFHVSSPELHPRNHYKSFVGGILLLRDEHFLMVNGFSNRYWGWGTEDDDFGIRMKKFGLKIQKPLGIKTGNLTFRHLHDDKKRLRDDKKYFNQHKQRPRDKTGIKDLKYKLVSEQTLTIDGAPMQILNVKLWCNFSDTPWCVKPEEHDYYIKKGHLPNLNLSVSRDNIQKGHLPNLNLSGSKVNIQRGLLPNLNLNRPRDKKTPFSFKRPI